MLYSWPSLAGRCINCLVPRWKYFKQFHALTINSIYSHCYSQILQFYGLKLEKRLNLHFYCHRLLNKKLGGQYQNNKWRWCYDGRNEKDVDTRSICFLLMNWMTIIGICSRWIRYVRILISNCLLLSKFKWHHLYN